MKTNKKMILVTQKNAEVDDPNIEDLYSFGCELSYSFEYLCKHIFFCIIVINDYEITFEVIIELTYVFLNIIPRC